MIPITNLQTPRASHASVALRWAGVLFVALLWEVAPRVHWVDATFVPPLSAVVATIGMLLRDGGLLNDVLASSLRALAGLSVALVIGVPLGTMLGRSSSDVRRLCDPFLRLLSQVNPFSLLPVFLLIFGSGEPVKVAAVAWVAVWPVMFFSITGVATADPALVKTAQSFGISHRELLVKVILPAAIPTLFVGVRIAANLVFFVLVGAEMLGTNAGLGWLVHNSAMNYQIKGIYAGALLVVLLGYGLSKTLDCAERGVHRVYEKANSDGTVVARNRRSSRANIPWHAINSRAMRFGPACANLRAGEARS
jgi:NitT/TauT family transport system permease protein